MSNNSLIICRSIPVVGYGIRELGMCLLDRNWEKDRKTFDNYLSNYVNASIPVCTYICPEGTTLSESTYQRSQAYAKKTNRPVFEVRIHSTYSFIACLITSFNWFSLYVVLLEGGV